MNNDAFNNFTNQNFSSLSKFLDELDPYEFALIGIVAAFLISSVLTINEQNSIGNFLEEVGQIILTIASQAQNVQGINNNSSTTNNNTNQTNNNYYMNTEINKLKQEIEQLKKTIKKEGI